MAPPFQPRSRDHSRPPQTVQRTWLPVPGGGPYLHVVPGGLSAAPDTALQPQQGAHGPVLCVYTQSCAHVTNLDEKEGKSGPVRHLKAPTGAPAGAEEGTKAQTLDGLSSEPPNEACPGWQQCLEPLDKRMLSPRRGAPINSACPRACRDSGWVGPGGESVLTGGLPGPIPREFDPRGPGIKF